MKVVALPHTFSPTGETAMFCLFSNGRQPLGRVALTKTATGEVYGHSWECSAKNQSGGAMLYFAARKQARIWSGGKIFIHFTKGQESTAAYKFWLKRGFTPVATIFEGDM